VRNAHAGQDVTMEVLDRDFGDGYEAERLPLAYVEYDHKADEVAVAVGGRDGRCPVVLRHAIPRPRRILTDSTAPSIDWAFDIVADDNSHTIVTIVGRPEPRSE
jgi:hypothetical protein